MLAVDVCVMSDESIGDSKENMLGGLKNGDFDTLLTLLGDRVFAIDTGERVTILHYFPILEGIIF